MIQCTVLNASHEPLSVIPLRRGLRLLLLGKAIMLEEVPDRKFTSERSDLPMPAKVILKDYTKVGKEYYGPAEFNQRNLFVRDNYTCQYCGRHVSVLRARSEVLTRDHLFPQSRGGEDTWRNCVAACSTCNHLKDDRSAADFAKMLEPLIAAEQERYDRTTDRTARVTAQEALNRLTIQRDGALHLASTVQKTPTVAEILVRRSRSKT